MIIYSEGSLLRNTRKCVVTDAPTSQVYTFPTVMQMIMEYHKLWRYAFFQWHDVPTKNREYQ
jgi:hypothetical protein